MEGLDSLLIKFLHLKNYSSCSARMIFVRENHLRLEQKRLPRRTIGCQILHPHPCDVAWHNLDGFVIAISAEGLGSGRLQVCKGLKPLRESGPPCVVFMFVQETTQVQSQTFK